MQLRPAFFLLAFAVASPAIAGEQDFSVPLPASPLELIKSEQAFGPFAKNVRAEVERLLGVPAAVDDPATLRMLLSTRVHLAHHFADEERAVATAAWIRSQQTDLGAKAFAGLTTLAAVAARRAHPRVTPSDRTFRQTFFQEFAQQLARLPHTPEIVTTLRGQREKVAGTTEAALLAEARDFLTPALGSRRTVTLAEADQIVRTRHRLEALVPVREETLRALDAAIAARRGP